MSSSIPSTIAFNGSSTFSSAFQNVLNRAVQFAQLPVQLLQNDVTDLKSKQSALSSLGQTFNAVQTALSNIDSSTNGAPVAGSTSVNSVMPTASAGALPGVYQVQVDTMGSSTTTMSNSGPTFTTVTDPSIQNISTSTAWSLTVNGTSYNINPAATTLNSLVTAINNSGAGVQATIVNVGSTATPDYRLAVNSTSLAPDSIQLNDGTQDTLGTLSTGSKATYRLNGSATEISTTSHQITISPGLTANLLQTTTAPVTISVAQSTSALQSNVSTFVNAYNAAVSAVGKQRGESGGPLVGDSLIFGLSNALGSMVQYKSGSGAVQSLADLGVTLNQDGTLTFSASTFSSASASAISTFLGGIHSGGFLQTMNNAINSFTDPVTGSIGNEYNTLGNQITADNNKITNEQATISTMQESLQKQLSAADAAIAGLQQQDSYFAQLFTATYGSSNPKG